MQAESSTLPARTEVTQTDEWIDLPLSSACLRVTDGSHFSPIPRAQGRPIVNVKDLKPGYVDIQSCTKIAEEDYQALVQNGCEIRKHDVLFSKDGTIGRVVVYKQEEPLVGLSSIAILRPGEAVDPFFLGQALQSSSVARQFHVLAGGSALRRLVLRDINRICVSLPPLAEQRSIAVILDRVDEAIAKTEAVIAKLKQVRAGLLHDLLTLGLDENGQLRDPIAHPEQFKDSPLGRIPREWNTKPLYKVANVLDSLHRTPGFSRVGLPMVRVTDIKAGCLRLSDCARVDPEVYDEFTANYKPRRGDIVLSRVGSYGISSIVDTDELFCIGQNTVVITGHHNPWFLYEVLQSHLLRQQFDLAVAGSSQKTLSLRAIREAVTLDLPIDEQDRIADVLLTFSAQFAGELGLLSKIRKLKSGLMNDLLTGRVHVPEFYGVG